MINIDLIKSIVVDIVTYGFSTIALILSIFSFKDARKAYRMQDRINQIEEKLKKYELEEKEKEREEATKALVEARISKVSQGKYVLKIWNSGKTTAYNVDFSSSNEASNMIMRDKTPIDFLDSGKGFEEHVIVCSGMPSKFPLTTIWEDVEGRKFSKEQIVTI
jgi:hypothetical protein